MEPLRILIYGLNFAPEPTGIGRFTGDMARWLAARGHAVQVVSAPPYYPEWRIGDGYRRFAWARETVDDVVIHRCPLYVPAQPGGWRRVAHLLSFTTSSWLPVLWRAARWKPDIVFNVQPALLTAPGALYAAWLADALSWLHVQDFEIDAAFELGLLPPRLAGLARRFERTMTRGFDAVSTISPNMMTRLTAKDIDPARTLLFPNWVETDRIRPDVPVAPLRERLGIAPDTIVALYSGNIGRKQGIETIVEAAEHTPTQCGNKESIVYVLCGDGAGRRDVEAAIAARPQLAGRVMLLPLQPEADLPALLAMADIHLLPQRAEAADLVMPSKLGGMLASGRPVVAGAASDTQIAAAVAGCGVIVAPDDAVAMAAAVAELAADPARCASLGAIARRRAVEEWDRERVLERFETQLLERVAEAKRTA